MSPGVTRRSPARTPGKLAHKAAGDDADKQASSIPVAAGLAQPSQAAAEVAEVDPLRPKGIQAALSRVAAPLLDELQLHVHPPRRQASESEAQPLGGGSVSDSGLRFRRAGVA